MIDDKAGGRTRSGQTPGGRILAAEQLQWSDRTWAGQKWIRAVAAISIAFASIAAGCATGGSGEAGHVAPPSVTAPAAANASAAPSGWKPGSVVGVWEGLARASCGFITSRFNRCNAQQKITLTVIEGASGLSGFYRCGYGNSTCLGQNEAGKIVSAKLNGGQLTARVAMPDGTSCLYNGRTTGDDINGGYSCYGGGGLIETGSWRGRRSY
jgi:hypothetical protein